ncbi:hypothetical protein M1N79_03700 [Dehalococcoidia bacterium]|nr:hypothetical protein [Dehalococcoidia bacterium]MCL0065963.1 hypothetical protein [Dehalococcoidia bacterium]MCL0078811.1 hypothetical protein [Dehalococcoidia bacterium]
MKILQGRGARNFEEAAKLAFQERGVGDMPTSVAELFASIADANTLRAVRLRKASALPFEANTRRSLSGGVTGGTFQSLGFATTPEISHALESRPEYILWRWCR